MRRAFSTLAATFLLVAFALAQKPAEEKKTPVFEPAEIVSSADVPYPINSVAWGTVVFQVTVGPSGAAEEIKLLRGIPSLTEPAERALKKWTFTPAKFDGKPVRSTVQVAFVFSTPPIGAAASVKNPK